MIHSTRDQYQAAARAMREAGETPPSFTEWLRRHFGLDKRTEPAPSILTGRAIHDLYRARPLRTTREAS